MLYRANPSFNPTIGKEPLVTESDIEALAITHEQLSRAFELAAQESGGLAAPMFRDHSKILNAGGKDAEELFQRTAASLVILEKRRVHDIVWMIEGEMFPPLPVLRDSLKTLKTMPNIKQLEAA